MKRTSALFIQSCTVFFATAILYVAFISKQFDLNGIAEAVALDEGDILTKNHLLYRPLGVLSQEILQILGLHFSSIVVLQFLTALAGAAAIALFYFLLASMLQSRLLAACGSCFLATSWAWWVFSTDAMYIPVAAMFVAAALAVFMKSKSSASLLVCGGLTGLSILTWQANIFLVPSILIALLLLEPAPYPTAFRRHTFPSCMRPPCCRHLWIDGDPVGHRLAQRFLDMGNITRQWCWPTHVGTDVSEPIT
jgi:hypothetical protein